MYLLLQLVIDIHSMVQRHELFSELLRVTDHMKAFVFHRMDDEEDLHLRLEQSETDLAAARKAVVERVEALKRSQEERGTLRVELEKANKREEALETKLEEIE